MANLKLYSYQGFDASKALAKKAAGNLVFADIQEYDTVVGATVSNYYAIYPNGLDIQIPTKVKFDALKQKVDAIGKPLRFMGLLTGMVAKGDKTEALAKIQAWYGAQTPAITDAQKGDLFIDNLGQEWVVVSDVAVASMAITDFELLGSIDPNAIVTSFAGKVGDITLQASAAKVQLAMGVSGSAEDKELQASIVPASLERSDMAAGVTSALHYADIALQEVKGATGSSFVDVAVAAKSGVTGAWEQEITVSLVMHGVSGATVGEDGLATAADVCSYIDDNLEVVVDALATLDNRITGLTGSTSGDYLVSVEQVAGRVSGVAAAKVGAYIVGSTDAAVAPEDAFMLAGSANGALIAGVTYVDEKVAAMGVDWEVITD